MKFTNKEPHPDEKRIEQALVLVYENGDNLLVHGVGIAIESDLVEAGLGRDEAGPVGHAPKEPGLWVWEGIPVWRGGGYYDGDDAEPSYENGKWRRPDILEVTNLATGNFNDMFGPSRWPPDKEEEAE